jgi:hypothetical protein
MAMTYLEFFGTMLAFAVIVLGGVKAMFVGIENRMQKQIDEVWDRVNAHYHEIHCDNKACTALHTGNVILPRGAIGK